MELQISLSHRLWTRESALVQECQTAVKRLCQTGASDCPLSPSGRCTHSPGRIGYASGKLPYSRLFGQVPEKSHYRKTRFKLPITPFCGNDVITDEKPAYRY